MPGRSSDTRSCTATSPGSPNPRLPGPRAAPSRSGANDTIGPTVRLRGLRQRQQNANDAIPIAVIRPRRGQSAQLNSSGVPATRMGGRSAAEGFDYNGAGQGGQGLAGERELGAAHPAADNDL